MRSSGIFDVISYRMETMRVSLLLEQSIRVFKGMLVIKIS